ncbi:TetR/AcrR family transcriptional regulator [Teredinibacter franksiae]|uniref:TetR/AcrR family transcriptional regulator n=1 Tax=Teredinibacter franksiae TaxID=2761453 RepID=UPI0016282A82|nr:TetR/AcrR family transcriptional regulator [Teredinibacter franksiae]
MAQGETGEKILHAAGILFAERGFAETSLRTITGMAEVNLAAVNYHFGSKKELIQAVFTSILGPFCKMLDSEITKLEADTAGGTPTVEQVLICVSNALLKTPAETGVGVQRIMRLLSLAYTQSQEHLRKHLVANFGETYARCSGLLQASVSGLTPVDFYWRLNYMLGAVIFTLSSYESLRAILNSDYGQDSGLEDVLNSMIPSLAAILKAPSSKG